MTGEVKARFFQNIAKSVFMTACAAVIIATLLAMIPFDGTTLGHVSALEVFTSALGAFSPTEAILSFVIIAMLALIITAVLSLLLQPMKQDHALPAIEAVIRNGLMSMTGLLITWFLVIFLMFFTTISVFPDVIGFLKFMALSLTIFLVSILAVLLLMAGLIALREKKGKTL